MYMHPTILVGMITFVVFFVEAMLHYNIGVNSGNNKFYVQFPGYKDFFRIIVVLGFFSFMNGFIINYTNNRFGQ
jgi:hypothetical protein